MLSTSSGWFHNSTYFSCVCVCKNIERWVNDGSSCCYHSNADGRFNESLLLVQFFLFLFRYYAKCILMSTIQLVISSNCFVHCFGKKIFYFSSICCLNNFISSHQAKFIHCENWLFRKSRILRTKADFSQHTYGGSFSWKKKIQLMKNVNENSMRPISLKHTTIDQYAHLLLVAHRRRYW